jgi:hypothetical protein
MVGLRIEPEAHGTIRGLVCDKDVGSDVGAGRITGGHDGRPDDIRIVGDGIDSGGDGTSWCRNGKPVCQVVLVRDSALCDGGAGRISGGHDGRPDDIGRGQPVNGNRGRQLGDGGPQANNKTGTSWCWSGEPACQVVPACDVTGGHDGRPDDIGIAGDGIDSGGDGIRWCWSGEPAG